MSPDIVLLLFGVAALLATALLGIGLGGRPVGRRLVYGIALVLCAAMSAIALTHLLDPSATPSTAWLPLGLPWQGALFRLDALSAFFAFVVGLGGAVASLFALGSGRHESAPGRVLPFYPLFLAGMNLVVLADDAFSFLFCWEFMSLSSWALVMAHHQDRDNAHAGYVYLIMASFGTLALLLAFGLLAGAAGDYTFDAMRASAHAPSTSLLVLALVLLGAGSKAGVVPLHAWLPLAHPAAPSHVSALMSGVMTKVAVYGFIRIVFELLGEPQWWSGFLVLLAGGATAVLGVLYALMQHDLKRLLAYHTVENIGIIFIGLGLALAFDANGLPAAAALALTAALFHVFNHSVFKSLLFFGAGAVLAATGERDMERLGGLIHRMPKTAFAFLVGCIAISALPPLNGFVSEWLTFQAILQSPELPQWGLKIMVPAVGGMLALSAALAAACFVKAYGISFLGRPRSAAARDARETDGFSLTAMLALVALCLAAGILPGFVIDALAPAMSALIGTRMPLQADVDWLSIVPIAAGRSSYNGLLVFAFIALAAVLAVLIIHRFASHTRRRAPAWDCGAPDPDPSTQYTASSFAQPIRRVFGTWIFAAREQVAMPPPGSTAPARYVAIVRDLLWDWLYAPVADAVGFAADRLNVLQFLTIRSYLSLVFLALVTLLLVLAIWS
jgi:formate hydrogenlyase subunit 3/multisubunit Na+/H+ antiporter MnhD subunit